MPIYSTRRAYSLGSGRALHVLLEDRSKYVTFVVVQNGATSRVQHRVKFKLDHRQASDLARFIVGIIRHPRGDTDQDDPFLLPLQFDPDELEDIDLIDEDPEEP